MINIKPTTNIKTTVKILVAISLVVSAALLAAGCGNPKSTWLVNPPPEDNSFRETAGEVTFDASPTAEILFVIDNSASMAKHIQKVSDNIDIFVNAFTKNNPLEYNLAVTAVYDSRTFNSPAYRSKWGQEIADLEPGIFRIVSSQDFQSEVSLTEELRRNLKIGIQNLDQGGPQYEELFSPVAAIYGLSGLQMSARLAEKQKIFFKGEDSYKILFFVTDATDASDISPSELYFGLVAKAKGDADKIMSFAAIVPTSPAHDNTSCVRDPGGKPYKLEEFLKLTRKNNEGSNIVSLCESFGKKFSDFGKSIRHRTLARNFRLKNARPVINNNPDETLRVFYGRQEIPFEAQPGIIGFRYNPAQNSVWINPDFAFDVQPGAKVCLQYTAMSATGYATGLGEKHTCNHF